MYWYEATFEGIWSAHFAPITYGLTTQQVRGSIPFNSEFTIH